MERSGYARAVPQGIAGSHVQAARLSEFISVIHEAEDREALRKHTLAGCIAFGFESFNMALNKKDRHDLLACDLSSFDRVFHDDYLKYGFVDHDPIIASMFVAGGCFCWRNDRPAGCKREERLLEFLRASSVLRGIVFPLQSATGRISMVNVSSATVGECDRETVDCLSIIVRVAMIKAECLGLRVDDAFARLGDADLSARQIEILHWAAQGKSNGDIAAIVGQSKRAVDWHVSEILRKLKVASRSQAVALLGARRS